MQRIGRMPLGDESKLPPGHFCGFLGASATTTEALILARKMDPGNAQIAAVPKDGISNANEVEPGTPSDVMDHLAPPCLLLLKNPWICFASCVFFCELTQPGTAFQQFPERIVFNLQQMFDKTDSYMTEWAAHKKATQYGKNSFGGGDAGELSHNASRWAFLKDRHGLDLKFKHQTMFERSSVLLFQLRVLKTFDQLHEVLRTRCDYRHRELNGENVLFNAHTVEFMVRTKYRSPED